MHVIPRYAGGEDMVSWDPKQKAMATSNQSNGVDIVIKLIKELS